MHYKKEIMIYRAQILMFYVFNRFPDVDFGECAAPSEEIHFSLSTFTQINAPSSALVSPHEQISVSSFTQMTAHASPTRREKVPQTTQISPIKRTAKSKEDRILDKAQKERSKAYEKAVKSAQAANKKFAKAGDCLKVPNISKIHKNILNFKEFSLPVCNCFYRCSTT